MHPMNPLAGAGRALWMDAAGRDIVALCALEEGGAVAVRGALAAPPDAGTAEALWAGWGPAPAGRRGPHAAGAGAPWLVTLRQGDLRVWMGTQRQEGAGSGRPGARGDWWFARPLGGAPVRTATACFEPETGTVYVPYLAPGEGGAATGALRVLWFRSRWRDEPAVPPAGAAELLRAAAWSTGPGSAPRLVLFWLDESGLCHWGLWRRLGHEVWDLEHASLLGGGPPGAGAGAARRWHRLWLAPVPGGGARSIALATPRAPRAGPGGKESGDASGALLARLDVAAGGSPRYMEYHLPANHGPGPGRLLPLAEGDGAGVSAGHVDLAGWWMDGDADLVLLARAAGGALATVEGWLLTGSGAARRLGTVPASTRGLAVAPVAAAGTGPVTPCRLPLWEDAGGHPRPWPVPSGWLDALRSSGVAAAKLPGRDPGVPVLPAPARPGPVGPVPAGDARTIPGGGGQRAPGDAGGGAHPGPTLGLPARPPLPRERSKRETRPGGGLPASRPASHPRWRVVRQRSS